MGMSWTHWTVTAGQSKSMHNNATARVHLIKPVTMKLVQSVAEWPVDQTISLPVAFYGVDPDTVEQVLFTDCADLNFKVSVSNTKDFSVLDKSVRGTAVPPGACAMINVVGKTAGAVTTVSVVFSSADSEEELKETVTVSVYENLEAVYPPLPTGLSKTPQVVLPVGASRHVLLRGGPQAWVGKPSQFVRRAVSEDTDIVEATLLEEVLHPHTGARVLCRSLGETEVRVSVGNLESSTNKKPVSQSRKIQVICSEPAKISKVDVENFGVNNVQVKKPIVNRKTGRILTYSYRDWSLVTTVKDKEGRTFDNTSSLLFRYKFSNEDMVKIGKPIMQPFTLHPDVVTGSIKMPLKETVKIHPQGSKGDLDIQVAVVGYKADVLNSVGVSEPQSSIPAPPDPFQDEDYDYDYDDEGNFVVKESGIVEEISLTLEQDPEIDSHYEILKKEEL